jgi:hypothetical protein
MGATCDIYGGKYKVYRVLVGKLEGPRPHGRPRRRRENDIKMYFLEVGWGTWAGFIWLRIKTFKCGNVPSDSIKCGEFLDKIRTGLCSIE